MVSHGRKVNNFGLPRTEVFALIVNNGLLSLCNMCYEVADKGLMCGFVERWHRDTNIFHMPFSNFPHCIRLSLYEPDDGLSGSQNSKNENRMGSSRCPIGNLKIHQNEKSYLPVVLCRR